MPVKLLPLTESASRILLEGIVDYAGIYPPASLPIATAVRNFAHYRGGSGAWMLGRFVCPADQLESFSRCADALLPRDAGAIPWRLSAVGTADVASDMHAIAAFNQRHRVCFDEAGAMVDSYEARVSSPGDIGVLARTASPDITTYCEVPLALDPSPFIDEIASNGFRAKFRMGGVTETAFPAAETALRFLSACIAADVKSKATAGLHHVVCGAYPLTYETGAPVGAMFGFLNVFLSAAMLLQGASVQDTLPLAREIAHSSFEITEHGIAWRTGLGTHHFDRAVLQRVRERVVTSFGSCSFTEPVAESKQMGFA